MRLLDARSRAADLLALVPAGALPFIFLHAMYQPEVSLGHSHVVASDIAISLTILAAFVAGVKFGFGPLVRPRVLWAVAGVFLLFLGVSCFWQPIEQLSTHLTTWAKLVEYALLAPALVLLFRRRDHVRWFLFAFVAWSVAASVWGTLEFLGIVKEFDGFRPGQREVSFLGIYDFAVFAGATLAIGVAGLMLGERGKLVPVAIVAGGIGVALAAAVFAYAGLLAAAAVCAVVTYRMHVLSRKRFAIAGAVIILVGGGVAVLRGGDISADLSFLGIQPTPKADKSHVETGPQRAMLSYIGLRIWEAHPWLGVGFERSNNRYQPYLAAAKRKFPDEPPEAFPSAAHPWGVQDFWLQLLADTGVVGFALGVATFATALWLALRGAGNRSIRLIAAGWILVAAGTWLGDGIVAGIPLEAVTWLGFGLSAVVGGIEQPEVAQ